MLGARFAARMGVSNPLGSPELRLSSLSISGEQLMTLPVREGRQDPYLKPLPRAV